MPRQPLAALLEKPAPARVPRPQHPVGATADERVPVARGTDPPYPAPVADQRFAHRAALPAPQPDRAVSTSAEQILAIGGERNSEHPVGVPSDWLAGRHGRPIALKSPEPDGHVH